MKTDLFLSCGHCWVFQMCWQIECSTFTTSSFRIWNSSTGIPSPPLALFVVMLPKADLTSHSRMSGCSHHIFIPFSWSPPETLAVWQICSTAMMLSNPWIFHCSIWIPLQYLRRESLSLGETEPCVYLYMTFGLLWQLKRFDFLAGLPEAQEMNFLVLTGSFSKSESQTEYDIVYILGGEKLCYGLKEKSIFPHSW